MEQQRFYPMTIGQIIDLSFKVYKVNFLKFLAIVAIIQVPLTLVNLIIGMQVPTATGSAVNFGDVAPYALSRGLISWVAALLSSAALIRGVSQYYLGDDVSVGGAYGNVVPKLLTLIGASILVVLVITLGMVLFIIPGIIFIFWYTLTTQIIVIENVSAIGGMKRSKALVKGNIGKVFAVSFLMTVIVFVLALIIGGVGGFIVRAVVDESSRPLAIRGIGFVTQIVLAPLSAIALILLYYDLRIRKEGFDLQMLAQNLGSDYTDPNGPGGPGFPDDPTARYTARPRYPGE